MLSSTSGSGSPVFASTTTPRISYGPFGRGGRSNGFCARASPASARSTLPVTKVLKTLMAPGSSTRASRFPLRKLAHQLPSRAISPSPAHPDGPDRGRPHHRAPPQNTSPEPTPEIETRRPNSRPPTLHAAAHLPGSVALFPSPVARPWTRCPAPVRNRHAQPLRSVRPKRPPSQPTLHSKYPLFRTSPRRHSGPVGHSKPPCR